MRRLLALCGWTLLGAAVALAEECPGNPDAIGTSRTIVVDPMEHPRIGGGQYRDTLPLRDHEIVLTLDDGPLGARSAKVLDTLAHECVKATYFLVGTMARAYPELVRRIRDEGHTIGTHSNTHPLTFHKMSVDRAAQEINDGIANVTAALGTAPAPFFRIPGLLRADGVERYLASQHLQTWSIDFDADDWTRISPAQVYQRALQRIESTHRGILLLHDIHPRTVEALPGLLHELKRRGYHIVHVVPATPDLPKTATSPGEWLRFAHKDAPPAAGEAATDAEQTAAGPESDVRPVPKTKPRPAHPVAHGQVPLPPVPGKPHKPATVAAGATLPSRGPQLAAPSP